MKLSMFSTKQTLKIWLANKTTLRSEVHGHQSYSVFLPARNMRNGIVSSNVYKMRDFVKFSLQWSCSYQKLPENFINVIDTIV